ncbi:AN1-like Zinc finger [Candidatus Norongarragalina meridionalis]|nr:AN1-like Zinc finger [Candidatus Norongarragalina meridionalis]
MGFWRWLKLRLGLEHQSNNRVVSIDHRGFLEKYFIAPAKSAVFSAKYSAPICEYCGASAGGTCGFKCSFCHGLFCTEHRLHEVHSAPELISKPRKRQKTYGVCSVCKKKLNAFEKTACPLCHKILCHLHFHSDNHDCRPQIRSKPVGVSGHKFKDNSAIYDTKRTTYLSSKD